jgi:hypothetical protein
MKKIFAFILLLTNCLLGTAQTRMIVMSDIGGSDPDDTESMIHLTDYHGVSIVNGRKILGNFR